MGCGPCRLRNTGCGETGQPSAMPCRASAMPGQCSAIPGQCHAIPGQCRAGQCHAMPVEEHGMRWDECAPTRSQSASKQPSRV